MCVCVITLHLKFDSIPINPGLEGGDASVHSVIMRSTANAPADDSNLAVINHQRTSTVATAGISSRSVGADEMVSDASRCAGAKVPSTLVQSFNLQSGFVQNFRPVVRPWFKVTPAKNGRLFSVVFRSESLIVDADWRQSIAETNRSRQRYQCYVVVQMDRIKGLVTGDATDSHSYSSIGPVKSSKKNL